LSGGGAGSTRRLASLNEFEDFTGLRMSPQLELGKEQVPVHRHFERASGAVDELDRSVGVARLDFRRQTGGLGLVVSDYTVLNSDLHHGPLSMSPTT
jgi:hypothetical protein